MGAIRTLIIGLSFSTLVFAAGDTHGDKFHAPKAKKGEGVFFLSPKDGETVPQNFKVKMDVKGMSVAAAGPLKEHTGHHHLLIDRKSIKAGTAVPKGTTALHFGKGETETELHLKPGKHSLTLQFADGLHRSFGPEWSKTIHVTVAKKAHP